jgi:hypothetical protein
MKCKKCGKTLKTIEATETTASTELVFKDGIYIPVVTIFDIESLVCPYCQEPIEKKIPISDNLRVVHLSGIHKSVLIDLQDIPFDTKAIEWMEKLPKKIRFKQEKKEGLV